ncbi:hypothetical protein HMPREF1990_00642 [Porphyromonas gingivalis W4087]|nr:hypothetical protein HMPREF1988_00878 [Porphyromonas gingivalis F0185]ERJ90240.1 hypothetical protein HMPREF1990_00642 [Porphyromonas gingivalis W4087]
MNGICFFVSLLFEFFASIFEIAVMLGFEMLCRMAADSSVLHCLVAAYMGLGKLPATTEKHTYAQQDKSQSDQQKRSKKNCSHLLLYLRNTKVRFSYPQRSTINNS